VKKAESRKQNQIKTLVLCASWRLFLSGYYIQDNLGMAASAI